MKQVSKTSVNYRGGTVQKHCGNCIMYHMRSRTCDLVAGVIRQDGVCDRWEKKK